MQGIEDFMKSFGFPETDALTIIIVCTLVMMVNFAGGLFSKIILAFGGPIIERSLTQRTSFRLALVAELFLMIYIIYYHTALVPGIETAQMIYWGFVVLASPLLAMIGAQLSFVAFATKIEDLKRQGRRLERQQAEGEGAQGGDGKGDDED
ncbi:MAG: hypothetical protein ISR51_02285 [Rhodospirillales bacterium]|nr:hypothetical protein [Alphaproteobacteria bacterium]MBL6947481.1 hypothetical protein [Rhodospirillales bacterium]